MCDSTFTLTQYTATSGACTKLNIGTYSISPCTNYIFKQVSCVSFTSGKLSSTPDSGVNTYYMYYETDMTSATNYSCTPKCPGSISTKTASYNSLVDNYTYWKFTTDASSNNTIPVFNIIGSYEYVDSSANNVILTTPTYTYTYNSSSSVTIVVGDLTADITINGSTYTMAFSTGTSYVPLITWTVVIGGTSNSVISLSSSSTTTTCTTECFAQIPLTYIGFMAMLDIAIQGADETNETTAYVGVLCTQMTLYNLDSSGAIIS